MSQNISKLGWENATKYSGNKINHDAHGACDLNVTEDKKHATNKNRIVWSDEETVNVFLIYFIIIIIFC